MGQRSSVLIGIGIPIAFVIVLFTWGVIQNDGSAGKPGVNENFGEVELSTHPFSDFELTTLDGDLISIKDYRGKIVVVDFWSSWCPPCRKSIPHLTALQEEFGPAGLTIIGVTDEDETVVEPFVNRMGSKMDYTIAIDNRKKTSNAWMRAAKQNGIPTAFIVDRSGTIQYVGSPLIEEFESTLAKVMTGRYDQAKQEAAAPMIASARRSSAGQSWSAATNSYNETGFFLT